MAGDFKKAITDLRQENERLHMELRNAKLREQRAKKTCKNLLDELADKNLINFELQQRLASYQG